MNSHTHYLSALLVLTAVSFPTSLIGIFIKLNLGKINNMVLDIDGVEYFNVVQIYLNDKESTAFEILQTVSSKMLYDEIIWWEVDK